MKRIQIITGHYGSGKTEYAVNLALRLAAEGKKTVLADLDIVNPYFRSYEQTQRLEAAGIRVIVTSCGGVGGHSRHQSGGPVRVSGPQLDRRAGHWRRPHRRPGPGPGLPPSSRERNLIYYTCSMPTGRKPGIWSVPSPICGASKPNATRRSPAL